MLDPIDGTKSFIGGFPIWGTLIALLHKGAPVYGMMHQPFIGERFSGDNGSATYKGPSGERRLQVRRCASLSEATSYTTSPLLMNERDRAIFSRIEQGARLSRYGGDCYSYCMLAAGHVDLVVETELKPYDIAALIPIVTGAGGVVTTWEGKPAQGRRPHHRGRRRQSSRRSTETAQRINAPRSVHEKSLHEQLA
ncbi:histidinol phosphatase-like enzyme (inositol monophosphatase family) [Bradyrhizobium japonicum]